MFAEPPTTWDQRDALKPHMVSHRLQPDMISFGPFVGERASEIDLLFT